MSFRIDDILKKDTTSYNNINNNSNKFELKNDNYAIDCTKDSILHQTLLSKSHQPYSRSISEPYLRIYSNNSYEASYLSGYCNYFMDKVSSYSNYMPRNHRSWAPFVTSTYPLMLYPPFSSHCLKRKGGQVRFTANQTDALEKRFLSHKYLSPEDRRLLADSLKLTDRQVKTWFQNRRAKWRRSNSTSTEECNLAKDINESDEESSYKPNTHCI